MIHTVFKLLAVSVLTANGRAYATVLRLSSVTCIVAKRCILEQQLLLTQPIGSRI